MKRNENYSLRNIYEIYFLSPSDDMDDSNKKLVILNETSAFLWKRMGDSFTVDGLVKALSDRYEVSSEIAYQHVVDFISFLSTNGCLDLI